MPDLSGIYGVDDDVPLPVLLLNGNVCGLKHKHPDRPYFHRVSIVLIVLKVNSYVLILYVVSAQI